MVEVLSEPWGANGGRETDHAICEIEWLHSPVRQAFGYALPGFLFVYCSYEAGNLSH